MNCGSLFGTELVTHGSFKSQQRGKVIPGGNSSPWKKDWAIDFRRNLYDSTELWDTSCGLEMKGWISAVAPFVGSTTWRADPRVLPRARYKKRNSLERKGVHPHPGRSCGEDELVYPHPKELRYVWGWEGTVAVSSWVHLSHCTVKRWMCPSPDTSDASLQGFQLFLL